MAKDRSGDDIEEMSSEERELRDKSLGWDGPKFVDEPGEYLTRSGAVAVVKKVVKSPEDDYPCKGEIQTPITAIACTWTKSGRCSASGEKPSDLVSKKA